MNKLRPYDLTKQAEVNQPRPYDLTKQAEVNRLIRELRGYMKVSVGDGTDAEGRQYALTALNTILDNGWEVVCLRS